jgi:two-component system, chemotaxis family, sensor kinase CheA
VPLLPGSGTEAAVALKMRATNATPMRAEAPKTSQLMGKYKEIIVAVAFFLLFDLGVLVLNFWISFQISEDATAINLAGRQRMLSQRITKSVYAVEDRLLRELRPGDDGVELDRALRLFDETLRAFREGGTATGGDGQSVKLKAVDTSAATRAVSQAQELWFPLLDKSRALLAPGVSPEVVADSVAYARNNNTRLLGLMNDLTTALEADAAQRATNLRWVQTGGIALALLNFVFILFKFIRRLRESDQIAEAAAKENSEILASVKEGLFLITPDLLIGTQIAKASHELFGRPVSAGEPFLEVLRPLVSPKVLDDTKDYIDLLFSPHVKEQLAQSINPLTEVEAKTTNRLGHPETRTLSFGFFRSQTPEGVAHLLVTVQDMSSRKRLEDQLKAERSRSQKEFGMLIKAFEADPGQLRAFVLRAEKDLLDVNQLLRGLSSNTSADDAQSALREVFRRMHTFKGDAQMMGLEVLAIDAHTMEEELVRLRNSPGSIDGALLSLPLPLDRLLAKVQAFKDLTQHRQSHTAAQTAASASESSHSPAVAVATMAGERAKPAQASTFTPTPTDLANTSSIAADFEPQIRTLAAQIARDCGKQVTIRLELDALPRLPDPVRQGAQDIIVQLLRNAMVHGIELPSERLAAGKQATGHIQIRCKAEGAGHVLSVRDDGQGLHTARIRARLVELGWFTEQAAQQLSAHQVIAQLFKSGFSTARADDEQTAQHAGRGVGLDVVQSTSTRIGGRLNLATQPGQYSEFRVHLSA